MFTSWLLCIKVGRGQGDGDIGTRVWGLGTWGRETRDLRTSSMGRGHVWDGDAGTSNTGTLGRGIGIIIAKVVIDSLPMPSISLIST